MRNNAKIDQIHDTIRKLAPRVEQFWFDVLPSKTYEFDWGLETRDMGLMCAEGALVSQPRRLAKELLGLAKGASDARLRAQGVTAAREVFALDHLCRSL